ncbi:hypothetical protein [Sphingomonas hylomeconis]|uniref:Uncharacterized protein n=1 Tax=Sphingomonas hylomeconis TaxID=1395958 RepID=A0ABV7SRP0_9SPHN|nr:hypothetical protein [Sphingomonas hylomeconis]
MTDSRRMNTASTDYFARREAQERALCQRATDPGARIAHEQLAKRYAELSREPELA